MNKILNFTVLLAILLPVQPAVAHHSAAMFDFEKTANIEGIVKEVKVANPHLELVLEVTDEKGTRDIVYEGHSRNNLYRRGWRPDSIKVGDKITITIATPKKGGDGGYIVGVKTAGGLEF